MGNYFARLKGKTETSKLEERLENAQLQSEKLNERFETALREKEEIRLEKEQINMLLTRRNSEFENLESPLQVVGVPAPGSPSLQMSSANKLGSSTQLASHSLPC